MIAGSPLRNDISNLGQGSQVEMQHTSNAYHQQHHSHHHSHHSSAISWKQMTEGFSLNGQILGADQLNSSGPTSSQMIQQQQQQQQNMSGSAGYDQMMAFQSDEEDCFDQLSDQGGDDSVSSVGLDDTRIQQL
jgi:hypothetical protein